MKSDAHLASSRPDALPPSIYHPQGNFAAWLPHAQTSRLRLGWWCCSLSSRSLSRRLSVWASSHGSVFTTRTNLSRGPTPSVKFRLREMTGRFTRRCNWNETITVSRLSQWVAFSVCTRFFVLFATGSLSSKDNADNLEKIRGHWVLFKLNPSAIWENWSIFKQIESLIIHIFV